MKFTLNKIGYTTKRTAIHLIKQRIISNNCHMSINNASMIRHMSSNTYIGKELWTDKKPKRTTEELPSVTNVKRNCNFLRSAYFINRWHNDKVAC